MSLRSELIAALKPLLPAKTKLVDIPRSIDGLESGRPVIMVYRENVTKAPNGIGTYFNSFALWIVNPGADPSRAEDALDVLLDQVIEALDTLKWLNWTNAERSVFGDNQAPAYKITLQLVSEKD